MSQEWPFEYNGNLSWLKDCTILMVDHGSRAYGTHRPDSDYDYKGVAVAPQAYRDGFLLNFEQAEIKDVADAVIYDVRKFFKLASQCNPTLIEMLFIDDSGVYFATPEGEMIRERRQDFLSQKALFTFRGYAISQLKRIERHRHWLLNPPKRKPERADFGLRERSEIPTNQVNAAMAEVRKRIDSWSIDFGGLEYPEVLRIQEKIGSYLAELQIGQDEKFQAAARLCGLEENFIHLLTQERRYDSALDHWNSYCSWKEHRNESRAALEAEFGYDTKHGMHLVRLMRMCREILVDKTVHVLRPDAEELLAIRNGAWSYDRLIEWATAENDALVTLAKESTLPSRPNLQALDALCQEVVSRLK